ncbi:MAG: ABC transporter permease [Chitinophagales bacterium]|nr:ABC transporter permease [Chitinophagales bacterium]
MNTISQIAKLVKKEFKVEWRDKTIISSIFAYVVGAIYLVYLVFQGKITFNAWLSVFWIIVLFTALNAVYRTFIKEANEQFYYIKNVASVVVLINSKIIYNTITIFVLSIAVYFLMFIFFDNKINYPFYFVLTIFLVSLGFSSIFSLLSGITAKTQNVILLFILSFPLVLPLMLLTVKLSFLCDFYTEIKDLYLHLMAVLLLDMIVIVLSNILFPFIWKD